MSNKLLIAGKDENYLMMLAAKIFEELDDNIVVSVITDLDYLYQYINSGQTEEKILVLGNEYYYDNLNLTGFESIVLLDERESMIQVVNSKFIIINPYLNMDVVYDYITSQTALKEEIQKTKIKDTKLIAVYSPIGGSGKTTIAYGLCIAFSRSYKKTLYLNLNPLQDFGYLFDYSGVLDSKLEKSISNQDENLLPQLGESVINCGFDYLPPTRMVFTALGITCENYLYLINEIMRLNEYDYIVIDMVNELDKDSVQLIGQADKMLCIGLQDKNSVFRMKRLLANLDTSDEKKYLLLCNKYNPINLDYFKSSTSGPQGSVLKIKEYINLYPEMVYEDKIPEKFLKAMEKVSVHCI